MKDNNINCTVVNDIHRELEFISPDMPMPVALCNYIFALSSVNPDFPSSYQTPEVFAKSLKWQQVRQLNAYYTKQ